MFSVGTVYLYPFGATKAIVISDVISDVILKPSAAGLRDPTTDESLML
jgi:hypothetical protein